MLRRIPPLLQFQNFSEYGQRILFLILLFASFGILAITRDSWGDGLDVNSQLLCLLKDQSQGLSLTESSCLDADEWKLLSPVSITVDLLDHRRNYEMGIPTVSSIITFQDCASVLSTQGSRSERYDSRLQMGNYYDTLSTVRFKEATSTLDDSCADLFPSSWYYWKLAKNFEQEGDFELADLHFDMAYRLDSYWKDEESRGLNALRQAGIFKDRDEVDQAEEAYRRVIQSYERGEDENASLYIAHSYQQLAEMADSVEDRIVLLEAGILSHPDEADKLTPQYVEEAVAADDKQRLINFALYHAEDTRILYALVSGLVEVEYIEFADLMMAEVDQSAVEDGYLLAAQGLIASANGRHDEAVLLLNQAVDELDEIDVYNARNLLLELSRYHAREGDLPSAISAQERAVKLDQNQKWSWFRLAQLYKLEGNITDARNAIEVALKLDPRNDRFLNLWQQISQ